MLFSICSFAWLSCNLLTTRMLFWFSFFYIFCHQYRDTEYQFSVLVFIVDQYVIWIVLGLTSWNFPVQRSKSSGFPCELCEGPIVCAWILNKPKHHIYLLYSHVKLSRSTLTKNDVFELVFTKIAQNSSDAFNN